MTGEFNWCNVYYANRPALVETDSFDFVISGVPSQHLEDNKPHPISFISTNVSPVQLNHIVFEKDMLAIIYQFNKRIIPYKELNIRQ